jgi:hypothetical protein
LSYLWNVVESGCINLSDNLYLPVIIILSVIIFCIGYNDRCCYQCRKTTTTDSHVSLKVKITTSFHYELNPRHCSNTKL